MAISFDENDIEEFRDCFSLYVRERYITTKDQLTLVMRSLAFSPTLQEVDQYYHEYNRDGRIDFATFITILELQSKAEKCQQDIEAGFRAHDTRGQGFLPAQEVRHILMNFGDKMTAKEVDKLFQDAGVNGEQNLNYEKIIEKMLTPLPDI